MYDVLHNPLEMGWGIGEPKGHAQPFVFALVAGEHCVLIGFRVEGDVMVASFKINQAGIPLPPHSGEHPAAVLDRPMQLRRPFIHRD